MSNRKRQYGIRWPTGNVFPYPSRHVAARILREDGRRLGVLVVREGDPDRPEWEWTPWAEVTD